MKSGIRNLCYKGKIISKFPCQDVPIQDWIYKFFFFFFFKAERKVREDQKEFSEWKLRLPWPDSVRQIYLVDLFIKQREILSQVSVISRDLLVTETSMFPENKNFLLIENIQEFCRKCHYREENQEECRTTTCRLIFVDKEPHSAGGGIMCDIKAD